MLLELFALCATLTAPQEPLTAAVRTVADGNGAAEDLAGFEKRLARTRPGRIAAIREPAQLVAWRGAGLGALDQWSGGAAVAAGDRTAVVDHAFGMVRAAHGLRAEPKLPRRPGTDDLVKAAEEVWRDLFGSLGSGRRLDDIAPKLHAAVDQVRAAVDNLGRIDREQGELLAERLERIEKVDHAALAGHVERLTRLAIALADRPDVLAALRRESPRRPRAGQGVQGDVLVDRDTAAGRLVIGGFGRNVYDCTQVAIVIDPGGDDEYTGPAGSAWELSRLGVVVDLDGNDTYDAGNDGLGAATFGVGVLVDCAGNDTYKARDRSAGFGAGGAGAFVDLAGNDTYEFGDLCGGVGLGGTGLFLDVTGDDVLTAGVQSFGVGLPGGVGIHVDGAGDDRRSAGREQKTLAAPPGGGGTSTNDAVSVAFGAGVGAPPLLSGGLGLFVDIAGNDVAEAAGIAFGVGIRGGAGGYRDHAGDDRLTALDVAFGTGYAQGIGLFVDDAGDDEYSARRLAVGAASHGGLGGFVDRAGDDDVAALFPSLGRADRGGVAIALDLAGTDRTRIPPGSEGWQLAVEGESAGPAFGMANWGWSRDEDFVHPRLELRPASGEQSRELRGEGAGLERFVLVRR